MTRRANVLTAAALGETQDRLGRFLGPGGFNVVAVRSAAEFLTAVQRAEPDVAILESAAGGLDGFDLARALRAAARTAHLPVVVLASTPEASVFRQALDAAVDEVFYSPVSVEEFLIRIHPLLRLSTLCAELGRRARLGSEFGLSAAASPTAPAEEDPFAVLAVGRPSRSLDAVARALNGRARMTTGADPFAVEDLLNDGFYDGCVLVPDAEAVDNHLDLCAYMRGNPRLFNLPVVVLAPNETAAGAVAAMKRGATRLLPASVEGDELLFVLASLFARQRLRWRLRKAIEATREGAARDALAECYSLAFFERHLAGLVAAARTWRKHLTLVFFSIPGVADVRREFGDDAAAHLVAQIAQWIVQLIRVEDMAARFGAHDFCVALPDTPLAEATVAMKRIAGIISYTDFAVREVYQPINVAVEVGMAELALDDTAESLMRRTRSSLE